MLPLIPPAIRPHVAWYQILNPRSTRRIFTNTQAKPTSGTQTDMGMDMSGFRINDTGPVAVDMETSAGSVALWVSDSPEDNVSPKMFLCLYFSASANIIILQLDFCGNDARFCWLLAFPDEE